MLFAVRTATALHRLLDIRPALAGDRRIEPFFTLVPGSDFSADALAALDGLGARCVPWDEAVESAYGLILAASPNGDLQRLNGPLALLPHGAGFSKRLPYTRGDDSANGLNPAQLLRDGRPLADLHTLAHPHQLTRLAADCPAATAPATVVGDPTLDRLLESQPRRDRYREALGTGGRRLIALVSTWGEQSLFWRRPELPRRLVTELPYDAYQVALALHPNEHSHAGRFTLNQQLAPALNAGLVLANPYEEWGAVLVAADCVITDHGSTALYAAALDRPLVNAYDDGDELLPGTPMAELLERTPYLDDRAPYEAQLDAALADQRPGAGRTLAASAFAEQNRSLERLREHLYRLLGLAPPPWPVEPSPLPVPAARAHHPVTAFTVDTEVHGDEIRVVRRPASGPAGRHLAAEEDLAGLRHVQSAGLLFRRADGALSPGTADGWTARTLDAYPGCRTAAAALTAHHYALRARYVRDGALLSARIEEPTARDSAAVLSGLHAWLAADPHPVLPARVRCVVAGQAVAVRLALASDDQVPAAS
ncbi:translation initiation factor 2 [Streptomyces gobiensis]|uniref:translation initiation factor 2 n=1 Tax=Streptomyces gobiensis TaxID=2875706 RepID=UPI001E3BB6FE|nr:translation initiation factor 2 [Streptomyces gobiensis]UGY90785.1 translation initiation factor 2 [Streptomyces gobiensis]